jgi:hypothetical protein
MALPVQYPLINGYAYSFASVELSFGGIKFRGFKEIKYSHKVDIGKIRGNHPQVLARTRGDYDAEGSVVLWQHEWDYLRNQIGSGYLEAVFPISVVYSEVGTGTTSDLLHGCRFLSVEKGASQGADGNEVSVGIDIMKLIEGGKAPLVGML